MNALTQLKDLVASDPSSLSWRKSGELIAKHGLALTELIESACDIMPRGHFKQVQRFKAALYELTEGGKP